MDNLRELQLVELAILKETLRLFEKHNIPYFALGGTMLGAIRHQGFIPWDDDIDIGVPREDFERLPEICKELPAHLHLHSYENDPDYAYYFPRIEDDSIQVRSLKTEKGETLPAWIDIFPLDGMPNGKLARRIHERRVMAARALFQVSRFDSVVDVRRKNRPAQEKLAIWCIRNLRLQKLFDRRRFFRVIDRALKRCPYKGSNYNINAMGAYKLREMFDKRVFGEGALYPFEDTQIRGAADYEAYLTQLYGDWRTPADRGHHSVVEIIKKREPFE